MPRYRLALERVLPILVLLLALVSVPWMVLSPNGMPRLTRLRAEAARVDTDVEKLGQRIRELRAQVERIKTDPRAVEQVARDELGLTRRTEVVFQFNPAH